MVILHSLKLNRIILCEWKWSPGTKTTKLTTIIEKLLAKTLMWIWCQRKTHHAGVITDVQSIEHLVSSPLHAWHIWASLWTKCFNVLLHKSFPSPCWAGQLTAFLTELLLVAFFSVHYIFIKCGNIIVFSPSNCFFSSAREATHCYLHIPCYTVVDLNHELNSVEIINLWMLVIQRNNLRSRHGRLLQRKGTTFFFWVERGREQERRKTSYF